MVSMFYILYMHNHPEGDKSFCILQRSYRNIYFFIYRPDGDKSLCACAEGDITYFYFTDHPEDDKSLCVLKAISLIFILLITLKMINLYVHWRRYSLFLFLIYLDLDLFLWWWYILLHVALVMMNHSWFFTPWSL